jgi:hypothetical protein
MARLPSAQSITGPASLRPNAPAPVADMSGIARGAANLAGSIGRIAQEEVERQNVIDFAAADAYQTRQFLDMQNAFQQDPDYATIGERAERQSQDVISSAAELIRDPRARQQWITESEINRIRNVDALGDIGRQRANEAERLSFNRSLEEYSRLITEPTTPPEVVESARRNLAATIEVARQNGLYTPEQADVATRTFIDDANERRARNEADFLIRSDPDAAADALDLGVTGDPLTDARNARRIPVVAADDVDIRSVDVGVLNRFEQVQSVFGTQLTVISGARSDERNASAGGANDSQHLDGNGNRAIDVDVSKLSEEERVRLIETASAMGFTGIGVYRNSLHLDTREKRAIWGPSYHNDSSVPAWARDVLDRHAAGQIAEVPVAAARGVDPRFGALSYEQRAALYDQAVQAGEARSMEARVGIETTVENAPMAIARHGQYDGAMPSANDFVAAYGAADGMERYEAFDASVRVAQDTYAMRTMTPDEIAELVDQSVPTSTGDDAAAQEQRFQQISQAADATIKAREADPSGYVMQVYPAVADAWAAVDADPANFSKAVAATAMAQQQLGITNPQLLPKQMAANTAATFNDMNISDAERMGALSSVVMATSNPEHQAAIYQQLLAEGVPEMTRPAMDALARGDDGAAQRLFRAAMVKPEDINKKLPGNVTTAQVDDEIQAQIFDEGQIGNIAYDLTYGATSNLQDAMQDTAVISNSVKLRLLDGSASNVQDAIDMTVRDMFGDVEVVTGSSAGGRAGMQVLLPTGTDRNQYQGGFDALLGEVGEALAADLENDLGDVPADGGQRAIADAAVANYVEQTLAAGYFTNAGDGRYKFIDPNGRGAVLGPDGEPLTFSAQQVIMAGAEARNPVAAAGAQFGASVQRPGGMQ